MRSFRNAASHLLTEAVSIPIALINSVILARWLSVADRGHYGLAIVLAGILVTIAQLGWPSAFIFGIHAGSVLIRRSSPGNKHDEGMGAPR